MQYKPKSKSDRLKMLLKIDNLHTKIENKAVLQGLSLEIGSGKIHAIMGPNGAGKTSLSMALMGHPSHEIESGSVNFNGKDLLEIPTHERARAGLFLSFQSPAEIPGVPFRDLLRQSYNALYAGTDKQIGLSAFRKLVDEKAEQLGLDKSFVERSINAGFSGGEKKRAETLQLMVLAPKLAILDELDSGLDIDALRDVCKSIQALRKECPEMSLLIITHYPRLLKELEPDTVHIIQNGKITQSGGPELAQEIEKSGYA
jgi:Fe-S cluster assembly ATP-binding protein